MATDLAKFAEENGVKYFHDFLHRPVWWSTRQTGARARNRGYARRRRWLCGFATWLDLTPAHPDMLAVPDPEAVIILPWNKEIAWVPATA